jgi:hypothetical protein
LQRRRSGGEQSGPIIFLDDDGRRLLTALKIAAWCPRALDELNSGEGLSATIRHASKISLPLNPPGRLRRRRPQPWGRPGASWCAIQERNQARVMVEAKRAENVSFGLRLFTTIRTAIST